MGVFRHPYQSVGQDSGRACSQCLALTLGCRAGRREVFPAVLLARSLRLGAEQSLTWVVAVKHKLYASNWIGREGSEGRGLVLG